jgi:hypothetical protein
MVEGEAGGDQEEEEAPKQFLLTIKDHHCQGQPHPSHRHANHIREGWADDSGASEHLTNNKKQLKNYRPFNAKIILGDGRQTKEIGIGTVNLGNLVLKDVIYAPEATADLQHRNFETKMCVLRASERRRQEYCRRTTSNPCTINTTCYNQLTTYH